MNDSLKPWPNCCLYHQTNGPRGAGCSVHLYNGWSATYTRVQTEQWLRDEDYFTEGGLAFVLAHPQVYLSLGGGRRQRVDEVILAYVRGQSCPGRRQKAWQTAKAFGDPFDVDCDTCHAPVKKPCDVEVHDRDLLSKALGVPVLPPKTEEPELSALVRVLDEKWIPLLAPYLNSDQQRELREDILKAAREKV